MNITPETGSSMPGYFGRRPAEGVLDELYAKSLVLEEGATRVAILALDLVHVTTEWVRAIRREVCRSTGIPERNILVSATHTHTGGPIEPAVYHEQDAGYRSRVVAQCVAAVQQAMRKREPARIGYGAGQAANLSFNRRYYMKDGTVRTNPGVLNPLIERAEGPIDPEVTVMRIDRASGEPIGVVTNFACHPDTIGGARLGGDYPGELSRQFKQALGNSVVSLFLLGACGNINHVDVTGKVSIEPDHYAKIGKALAAEVLRVRENIVYVERPTLAVSVANREIRTRMPSEAERAQARERIRSTVEEMDKLALWDRDQVELFFAKSVMEVARQREPYATVNIQTIVIGGLAIIAFPCEMFVEFGLEMKRKLQMQHAMISTLTNGAFGYVLTRQAYANGGYEQRLHSFNMFEPQAGHEMMACALELLKPSSN